MARFPGFAPAWKELAALLDDPGDRLRAIERGLAAGPDPETRGMLLLNKALVANQRGDRGAAIAILDEAFATGGRAVVARLTARLFVSIGATYGESALLEVLDEMAAQQDMQNNLL